MNAILNFIGHVRNHLHGLAQVITAPLLIEHGLIDLATGEIVHPRQFRAGESLVMAEIQIRFRAVVEHVNLPMLIGTHRARINVEIRIELLQGHLEPPVLKESAQRRGREPFAERTHHAAGDKNVFHFNRTSRPTRVEWG